MVAPFSGFDWENALDRDTTLPPSANALPAGAAWPEKGAALDLSTLYRPTIAVTRAHRIATLGGSVAGCLHGPLAAHGFTVLELEPPLPGMPTKLAQRYGYGRGSARVGALRSAAGLAQLIGDAKRLHLREEAAWPRGERWIDALRPEVEPHGLPRKADVLAARAAHLRQVRRVLRRAQILFLTLGASEDWRDTQTGTIYPQPPDPVSERFTLLRPSAAEIRADLRKAWRILQRMNPDLQIILSLCPLPLRSTASGQHILTATAEAQTALRSAVTEFVADTPAADLFPASDLLTLTPERGTLLKADMRDLSSKGSAQLLRLFLAGQGLNRRAQGKKTEDAA